MRVLRRQKFIDACLTLCSLQRLQLPHEVQHSLFMGLEEKKARACRPKATYQYSTCTYNTSTYNTDTYHY